MIKFETLRKDIGRKRRGIIHYVKDTGAINTSVGTIHWHDEEPKHLMFTTDSGLKVCINYVKRGGGTVPAVRAPGFTHVTARSQPKHTPPEEVHDESPSDAGDIVPDDDESEVEPLPPPDAASAAAPTPQSAAMLGAAETGVLQAMLKEFVEQYLSKERRRPRDDDPGPTAPPTTTLAVAAPAAPQADPTAAERAAAERAAAATAAADARKEAAKRAWEDPGFKITEGKMGNGTTYLLIPALKLPKKNVTINTVDGSALKKISDEAKTLSEKWAQHDEQKSDRPEYAEACLVMTLLAGTVQLGTGLGDEDFLWSLMPLTGYLFEVKATGTQADTTLDPNAAYDANTASRLTTALLAALGLGRDNKAVAHHADAIIEAYAVRHMGATWGKLPPGHALQFHKARAKIIDAVVRLGLKSTPEHFIGAKVIPVEIRDLIKAEAAKEKDKEKEKEKDKAQAAAVSAALAPLTQAMQLVASQRSFNGGRQRGGGGGNNNNGRGGNHNAAAALMQQELDRKKKSYSEYLTSYTMEERTQHVNNALIDLVNEGGAGNLPRKCREYSQVHALLQQHPMFVATASLTRGDKAVTCLKKMAIAAQIQPELTRNPVWSGLKRALQRREAVEALSAKQAPPASVAEMRALVGRAATPIERAFLFTWLSAGRLGERWRMALTFTPGVVEITYPRGQKSDLKGRRGMKKWFWTARDDPDLWGSALTASYDDCYVHMKTVTPHLTGHSIRRGAIQLLCASGYTVEQASWLSGHAPAQAPSVGPPGIRPYLQKDDGEERRRRQLCLEMSKLLWTAFDPSLSRAARTTQR